MTLNVPVDVDGVMISAMPRLLPGPRTPWIPVKNDINRVG